MTDVQVLRDEVADQALCAQVDPELFFPDRGGNPGPAKAVCARCPVRPACLELALAMDPDLPGVWGGTTVSQRRRIVRQRASA